MLQEVLAQFVISKRSAGLSEKTVEWYQFQLRALIIWLRARAIAENWPTVGVIEAFLADERSRLKPVSLAGRYRAMNVFFGWCVERELLPGANPMAKIKCPKVPKSKPRAATIEDFDRFLSLMPSETWIDLRDRLAVNVMFLCGLRLAEVTDLTVSDFQLAAGVLLVRNGKGGDARPVPLLPVVAKAFMAYLYVRPTSESSYVFISGNDDRPLLPNGLRLMLRRRCRALGIPYLNPRSFRHGLAMYVLNRGGDMSLVQKILGHSKIQTTADHYAKWLVDPMIKRFSDVMGNTGG